MFHASCSNVLTRDMPLCLLNIVAQMYIKSCLTCCTVLETEKLFIEAAKRNDVETMKTLGKGLNANAKNVVGLYQHLSIGRSLKDIKKI